MTKEEATKILSESKLILSWDGLNELPIKTILIDDFLYKDNARNCLSANMYACIDNKKRNVESNFSAKGFLIQIEGTIFYYRPHFNEALDVIKALRVLNDFEE